MSLSSFRMTGTQAACGLFVPSFLRLRFSNEREEAFQIRAGFCFFFWEKAKAFLPKKKTSIIAVRPVVRLKNGRKDAEKGQIEGNITADVFPQCEGAIKNARHVEHDGRRKQQSFECKFYLLQD
ncbi:MAG: hypothetical protein D6714_09495 [Bacteroidetes bacterium]|nr:MAG: hypothetical protein D6714_09495 [Bacteroidota bacterium]